MRRLIMVTLVCVAFNGCDTNQKLPPNENRKDRQNITENRSNVRNSNAIKYVAPQGWTIEEFGQTFKIQTDGFYAGLHNHKSTDHERCLKYQTYRYTRVESNGYVVTVEDLKLGGLTGKRWLVDRDGKTQGHYVLENPRGTVFVELFEAESQDLIDQFESFVATITFIEQ